VGFAEEDKDLPFEIMDISNLRENLEEEYRSGKKIEDEEYLADVIENRINLNDWNA
jgi:hypothetical protein